MSESGGVRASDAEREAVVEWLKNASVEGRLTLGELTERTEAAYTATTRAELDVIVSDLPGTPGGEVAPRAAVPAPARGGRTRRWFVAVMGDTKRRGKWRVDRGLGAVAVMGDVTLDLREAEVRTEMVDIAATAVMGDVKIIVPDGVDIDLDGIAIMGDKHVEVAEAAPGTNAPIIRIKAYAIMGDIKIIGDSRAERIDRPWAAWREQWHQVRHDLLGHPLPPAPPPPPVPPSPRAGPYPRGDAYPRPAPTRPRHHSPHHDHREPPPPPASPGW